MSLFGWMSRRKKDDYDRPSDVLDDHEDFDDDDEPPRLSPTKSILPDGTIQIRNPDGRIETQAAGK